ncbi:hypothetical protein Pmar_PMAR012675 [Perkinsus marinus ATCC 50983]|uniref:Uncharacterized protein n=1 Tax=Perkinsus marinus (strain ATCC 50983 / TXsc) TaxID=423536 RepID=C5K802_PERM5|nr:hypothetical protein Pmar_PMAR012675 [Perkinsus marinus ATCC 50983]EER19687.1 hypothetical protein Pmar_PMAR012675 [Perkinsus marinus ATCC 50983]|eukprot:XP_002787891.1 hypothetical protein Pmar_PMAR012675 [Perkinsus marinus ATCC 50983]
MTGHHQGGVPHAGLAHSIIGEAVKGRSIGCTGVGIVHVGAQRRPVVRSSLSDEALVFNYERPGAGGVPGLGGWMPHLPSPAINVRWDLDGMRILRLSG